MMCLRASQARECSSAKGHSCMNTVASAGPALSDAAFGVTVCSGSSRLGISLRR